MAESKKILFFSPYSGWLIHSQVDAVVAKSLELRGSEVLVVICDGIFTDCYLTRHSGDKQQVICQSCATIGKQFYNSFQLPNRQIRDFITAEDYQIARQWIETVNPEDYANANYQNLPIGKWVTSSIYTYFRTAARGLARPEVRKVHKEYLIDGLVTYKAISRLLDFYQPTHLFTFNGRIAPYRIALEVAHQRQIDVITHERGYIADSFSFYDNCNCLSLKPPLDCVSAWENIPLNHQELLQVKQYFTNREGGLDLSWPAFYKFQTDYAQVRRKLRIPADAKIFTVFTSSEDELSTSEDYAGITEQLDIIARLIDIFTDRDEYLVIRHHPHIGGIKENPPETHFLTKAYRQALNVPKNVRIVMPSEPLTSYALIWNTDAAIAFFSTVSIEAAARGVPTATFQLSRYHKALQHVIDNHKLNTETLRNIVDRLLSESSQMAVEDFRQLYRFTHAYFFKFSTKFRSFGAKDFHQFDLRLNSVDELKPGIDPALDRICDRILRGTSLYEQPGQNEKNRSPIEEERFLQQELNEIRESRQQVKQQIIDREDNFSNPSVGIIYLKYQNEQTDNTLLRKWIAQSRHENIIVHCCTNLDWQNYRDIIGSILTVLDTCTEDYILVTSDRYQYDESFLSSALDSLLSSQNQKVVGVLSGAWLASPENGIEKQIFTQWFPALIYQQAVDILPLLDYPQTLLAFALIRGEELRGILNAIGQMPTASQAAQSIFSRFGEKDIDRIGVPLLVMNQSAPIAEPATSSQLGNAPQRLLSQVAEWLAQYQKDKANPDAIAHLRQIRQQIAELWLSLSAQQLPSAYTGDLGKAHLALLNSGLKFVSLIDTEQAFIDELSANIALGVKHPQSIQYLLAAMLYRRADQLPLEHELDGIPPWFLSDYLKFILESPTLFKKSGEVDSYHCYLQGWLDYFNARVIENHHSKFWQNIALLFAKFANFIPLYFSDANLKYIYSQRADIMEFGLKARGAKIDSDFPERSVSRTKIRLGVLNAHFTPQTETFQTIPVFENLDRNQFEIILYSTNLIDHPLEEYCQTRADRMVKLPSDLASQAQTIRADDLDILLIGTNITAVTHAITLLALHRLARIQVTFGASPTTTGMRNIDYFISGNLSEPVSGGQEHYREELVTLDGPGYCFNYTIEPEHPTISPTRESWGATEESVVFISGANCYKIIPELRESWAKILAAVPNSILVLYPFAPSWSSSYPTVAFLNQMHDVLARYGVDKNRLVVLNSLPSRTDVKECLQLADIYLDSYRHSGGHSLVDALEVGLPTVVLQGNALRSRHAAAYLRSLQVSDLITENEDDYIQLSVALGTNPELRKQKSHQIEQKMQDNPRFLDSRDYSAQIGVLFQDLFRKDREKTLSARLQLRDTNLIIFPDWSQPEASLSEDLASAIKTVLTFPNSDRVTLLIDTRNISEEDAELAVSGVVMNLLMEEELDIEEEPGLSLVGRLNELQWDVLLPHLQGRIILQNEDRAAIARAKADSIPPWQIDSFSEKPGVQG